MRGIVHAYCSDRLPRVDSECQFTIQMKTGVKAGNGGAEGIVTNATKKCSGKCSGVGM